MSRVLHLIQHFSHHRDQIPCCHGLHEKTINAYLPDVVHIIFVAETRAEAIASDIEAKN